MLPPMTIPPGDHETLTQTQARQLLDDVLTKAATGELLQAIAEDMQAVSAQATVDAEQAAAAEDRLVRIENQTQVLAEAVIAVTHTDAGAAAAVQAVMRQMTDKVERQP